MSAFILQILRLELVDAVAELLELADHGLDALGAEAEFFDQQHRTTTAAAQAVPGRLANLRLVVRAGGDAIVFRVALEQAFERGEIQRQAAENLLLLEPIGYRDLYRAIERQFAAMNAIEHLDGATDHVVASQQLAAEGGAGELDLAGKADFLLAGKQRDFAHLRQVHPHGVVGPGFGIGRVEQRFGVQIGIVEGLCGRRIQVVAEFVGFRIVIVLELRIEIGGDVADCTYFIFEIVVQQ